MGFSSILQLFGGLDVLDPELLKLVFDRIHLLVETLVIFLYVHQLELSFLLLLLVLFLLESLLFELLFQLVNLFQLQKDLRTRVSLLFNDFLQELQLLLQLLHLHVFGQGIPFAVLFPFAGISILLFAHIELGLPVRGLRIHAVHDGLVLLVFEFGELVEDIFGVVSQVKRLVFSEEGQLSLEDHFESPDFLLVLSQQSVLWVFVDNGFVLDELGPARVPQSAQGLFIVIIRRGNRRDHDSLRISTEGVIQYPCQFGVSVRDVLFFPIHQCRNHVSQGAQGQVDLGRLFDPLVFEIGLALPFRASQVDKVELTDPKFLDAVLVNLALLDPDGENAVGPGGFFVHGGLPNDPVFVPDFHVPLHVRNVFGQVNRQILHDQPVGGFLQVYPGLDILAQQVVDFFVVNFNEGALDQVLLVHLAVRNGHNLVECPWNDAHRLLF